MRILFNCPTDGCVALIEYEPLEMCASTIKCPRCGVEHPMAISDAMRRDNSVDACAVCGCRELFTRKDFPQRLGFAIVIVFGAAALYAFSISFVIAWAILAAAVLIDLAIYSLLDKVTTCYACRAEYRKCKLNPTHETFDLATSEKY